MSWLHPSCSAAIRSPRPLLSRFRGRFSRGMLLLGMFLSVLPPLRVRAEDEQQPPPVETWWGDVWRWIDGGQQWFAYQNVGEWGDDDGDDIPNGLDPYPWDASNNTGWLRASNIWSDAVLHETLEWAYASDRSWQIDWYDSDGDGLPNWCDPRLSLCRKGGHENQPELGTVSHEPNHRTYRQSSASCAV